MDMIGRKNLLFSINTIKIDKNIFNFMVFTKDLNQIMPNLHILYDNLSSNCIH